MYERKGEKKEPEIVLREGKPVAVLIDIDEYESILERLEDVEDLKILEEMRKRPLAFRKIDEFLKLQTSNLKPEILN